MRPGQYLAGVWKEIDSDGEVVLLRSKRKKPVEAFTNLIRRLLSKEQRRFIKFCLVGASGVPVNLLLVWVGFNYLFISLGGRLQVTLASALGFLISVFTNFLLNDIWTWADRPRGHTGFWSRCGRFYLVCSAGGAIQMGTVNLVTWMAGESAHMAILGQLCGIALATVINYVVNNFWTFKKES